MLAFIGAKRRPFYEKDRHCQSPFPRLFAREERCEGIAFIAGARVTREKEMSNAVGENGYCGSFNGKLRDECLNGEIFYSLKEAQIVIEQWRVEYNTKRPHSALGYRPPAPAAFAPRMAALRSPTAPCDPPFANLVSSEVVL